MGPSRFSLAVLFFILFPSSGRGDNCYLTEIVFESEGGENEALGIHGLNNQGQVAYNYDFGIGVPTLGYLYDHGTTIHMGQYVPFGAGVTLTSNLNDRYVEGWIPADYLGGTEDLHWLLDLDTKKVYDLKAGLILNPDFTRGPEPAPTFVPLTAQPRPDLELLKAQLGDPELIGFEGPVIANAAGQMAAVAVYSRFVFPIRRILLLTPTLIPNLRILAVPLGTWTYDDDFQGTARERMDFFLDGTPFTGCPCSIGIEYWDISRSYSAFSVTKADCGVSGIKPFVDRSGINSSKYDVLAGFVKLANCADCLTVGCSNGVDTIWAQTEGNYPEIFAHEMGHIFDLEDEYCSNQAGSVDCRCNDGGTAYQSCSRDINYLSASTGCDPRANGNCCGVNGLPPCSQVNYGACCLGNLVIVDGATGRSIMSYAGAPSPRAFEQSALDHLATMQELKCLTGGGGRASFPEVIDVDLRVHSDGTVKIKSILLRPGVPTDYNREGKGNYRLVVLDDGGDVTFEKRILISFRWEGPVIAGIDYSDIRYDYKDLSFKIPYSPAMKTVQLFGEKAGQEEVLLFQEELSTCDGDGICDPGESASTCPQDCPPNAPDGICDPISDGICDPDCYASVDSDCIGVDSDGDDIPDSGDNCRLTSNPGQEDTDLDGLGDACADSDGDGVLDSVDNCIQEKNPGQEDDDEDRRGDACDPCPLDRFDDADRDGVCGEVDDCPDLSNADQSDQDNDEVGDLCDLCPAIFDPEQADSDGDGIGDACRHSPFRRGDANVDGSTDISDGIFILDALFFGTAVVVCGKANDTNDDGQVDISDGISVLAFLFLGGESPPAPFPDCGMDPTADLLTCESAEACR
jgi:hypothetical protein